MLNGKNILILIFAAVGIAAAGSFFYLGLESDSRTVHEIILPEDQYGYRITSDKSEVGDGGSYTLTYRCKLGYVDEDLRIEINSMTYRPDGSGKLKISNVHKPQTVEVFGVKNHNIMKISIENNIGADIEVPDTVNKYDSYTVKFSIKRGYAVTDNTVLKINEKTIQIKESAGSLAVDNVESNQTISIKGLELKKFTVSSGANVLLGLKGSTDAPRERMQVTVEDTIVPTAKPGYAIPDTYCKNYDNNGNLIKSEGGFRVEDNTAFPAVFRLEVGKNILVNGNGAGVFYFTPYDQITFAAGDGYTLPDEEKFKSKFENLRAKGGKFALIGDQSIPDLFKAEFVSNTGESYRTDCYFKGERLVLPSDPDYTCDIPRWTHKEGYEILEDVSVQE